MAGQIYLPDEVRDAIGVHVRSALDAAIAGFGSAEEDEDAVTGAMGQSLRVTSRRVTIASAQEQGTWTWSVEYAKLRGRGRDAPESYVGADGIFEISVDGPKGAQKKCLLFQAKMGSAGGRNLLEQCIKLSTWREAAIVLEYTRTGYNAISLDEAISGRGSLISAKKAPLADYLVATYLACKAGDTSLHYVAPKRTLIWQNMDGETVGCPFRLNHRIRFSVQSPGSGKAPYRTIGPREIHQHRMSASAQEILQYGRNEDLAPREAQKQLLKTYHPDLHQQLDPFFLDLLTKRAQEISAAGSPPRRGRRR